MILLKEEQKKARHTCRMLLNQIQALRIRLLEREKLWPKVNYKPSQCCSKITWAQLSWGGEAEPLSGEEDAVKLNIQIEDKRHS